MALPVYAWDEAAARYRDLHTGQFIAEAPIRAALDRVLDAQSAQMRLLSTQLQGGRITLAEWQASMAAQVKQAQIIGGVAARGGWAAMTPADWGFVGSQTKAQYHWLQGFAAEIASGQQPLDGTLVSRAEMYGQAGRSTYIAQQRRMAAGRYEEERSVLAGAAQHCPGCLDEAAKGYRPLGSLIAPGSRQCRSRCRCALVFRTRPGSTSGAA